MYGMVWGCQMFCQAAGVTEIGLVYRAVIW